MAVRAKFSCTTNTAHGTEDSAGTVTLFPDYSSDENKAWAQYTPSGKVEMYITNPTALQQFVPGQQYYVDFTPAESSEQA